MTENLRQADVNKAKPLASSESCEEAIAYQNKSNQKAISDDDFDILTLKMGVRSRWRR